MFSENFPAEIQKHPAVPCPVAIVGNLHLLAAVDRGVEGQIAWQGVIGTGTVDVGPLPASDAFVDAVIPDVTDLQKSV